MHDDVDGKKLKEIFYNKTFVYTVFNEQSRSDCLFVGFQEVLKFSANTLSN